MTIRRISKAIFVFWLSIYAIESRAQIDNSTPLSVGDSWRFKQTSIELGAPSLVSNPLFRVGYKNTKGDFVMLATASKKVTPNTAWKLAYLIKENTCLFDVIGGHDVANPCPADFNLNATWQSDKTDSVSHVQINAAVIGREQIVVPAGTFEAIKIDQNRLVADVIYPGVNDKDAGTKRFHTIYWYAPKAKAMVKVIREFFDISGNKYQVITEELDEYSVK